MPKPLESIESGFGFASQICRWTRAIEHEGIGRFLFRWIEAVRVRIELHEWNLSSLELGEEWPEPVGVLVENCNWLVVPCGHVSISVEVRKTKKPRSGGSRGRIGVEGIVPCWLSHSLHDRDVAPSTPAVKEGC